MKNWILLLSIALVAACKSTPPKAADVSVPVTVSAAQQKDVPLQIGAVGIVQPLQTVAVRVLVSGQLTRVWFREGDDVHRGQMLFSIDPRPYQAALRQSQAILARDEAQLLNAEAEKVRYASLRGIVSREQYDAVSAAAGSARAIVAADRAAVDDARQQLSYCDIRSPLDGRAGALQVHEGNILKANDVTPVIVINQVRPISVQFSLPEGQLAAIRAAGEGIPVTALPQGGSTTETGRLTFIDNAVDQPTGTIALKATFANDHGVLWPGQYANATVTVSNRPNAVVVPAQAVQTSQNGQYVYIVRNNKSVELRPVTVAQQIGQLAIVGHGVAAGEMVVTDGQMNLTPASKVSVKAQS
ncbi:MAG: rane fusion protein multidrug efflux system [Thermoanaerobaculia bacterium]|jgi:multidrug efflux system membrane fusion protein|nr:rane fusion protein multidrug efflux system [Thermoanaerobaculia bacterium]